MCVVGKCRLTVPKYVLQSVLVSPQPWILGGIIDNHSRILDWIHSVAHLQARFWTSGLGWNFPYYCWSGHPQFGPLDIGWTFHSLYNGKKEEGHKLITSGLYSILRHPGYTGYFWWYVGGQLLLFNPISLVPLCIVASTYFKRRICVEERILMGFFPGKYPDYRARTAVLIPFL